MMDTPEVKELIKIPLKEKTNADWVKSLVTAFDPPKGNPLASDED
ncbi:MAG TPA: hypothetical protein PK760_10430 [Flavobacteriales bacterium]|nr:hypothetical protein [Flavobacteriales bacterium]